MIDRPSDPSREDERMSEGKWNPMAQRYERPTLTLAEFLLARIAEDERLAKDASRFVGGSYGPYNVGGMAHVVRELWRHANHWTPTRVLAECEAKRRILAEHPGIGDGTGYCGRCVYDCAADEDYPCATLRALAMPYADHPDYRADEWRP